MNDKRILFLISNQHLIRAGGIGTFTRAFNDFCNDYGYQVDFAADKKAKNANDLGIEPYTPSKELGYGDHNSYFFYNDSINLEKVKNFQTVLLDLVFNYFYDVIVCNTPEAAFAAYQLGLHRCTKVVYYSHFECLVEYDIPKNKVFNRDYVEFFRELASFNSDMVIGTQSDAVSEIIGSYSKNKNIETLPLMVPNDELENYNQINKWASEGVLFIGRYEDRKGAADFVDMIKFTGLPAKIMTNKNGANKFKKEFDNAGITDYEIRYDIEGEEKMEFVSSARIGYFPSYSESFSYALLDAISFMPCFVYGGYPWTNTWLQFRNARFLEKGNGKQNNYALVQSAYHNDFAVDTNSLENFYELARNYWKQFIERQYESQAGSNKFTKLLDNDPDTTFTMAQMFNQIEQYQDTVVQAYKACHSGKYKIKQEENKTLLTLNGDFNIIEKQENNPLEDLMG